MTETPNIRAYDTMTRSVRPLAPIVDRSIKMFVCGPTVYDFSHLGHAKTYTQFDFVARYLRHRGYSVFYLQNITDIDDKIIQRAQERGRTPEEIAREFEAHYLEDMQALGNTSVDKHARALEHIDDIIDQVKRLLERGHAYTISDGVYFDTKSFPGYGKLSRRSEVRPDDAVSRIDENPEKRQQSDFCLWKFRKADEPWWDAPFGQGRPGWHIEDTAITEHYFGPQYDLHGGAIDLIFPHHEAEIAQMEAASGKEPLVRHWMHTGFLNIGTEKMSKSLANFRTIRQTLEVVDYRVLRYYFLSHHYRRTIEFTEEAVASAKQALGRLDAFARTVDPAFDDAPAEPQLEALASRFYQALDDDFDTPRALGVLFDFVREQNRSGRPGRRVHEWLGRLDDIFGFLDLSPQEALDPEIESLVRKRDELRAARDYKGADEIRERLAELGVVLEDTPDGTRWHR